VGSLLHHRMTRDLLWGVTHTSSYGVRPTFQQYGRENAMAFFADLIEKRNRWERKRAQLLEGKR
jgi:hypothetical protein